MMTSETDGADDGDSSSGSDAPMGGIVTRQCTYGNLNVGKYSGTVDVAVEVDIDGDVDVDVDVDIDV